MKPSSAAPTLTKERVDRLPLNAQKALYDITDIANWLDDENQPESATLIEARDILIAVLEAPPATERTALKELRKKVESLRGKEWYRYDVSQERTVWRKFDIPTIDRVLSLIDALDAASASEGTKSE